jgi:hypothetical protein
VGEHEPNSEEEEEFSPAELERQRLYQKRLQAIELRGKGQKAPQIAEQLEVVEATVRKWFLLYDIAGGGEKGRRALRPRVPPGRERGSTFTKRRKKPRW